jgi:hypothetical protein
MTLEHLAAEIVILAQQQENQKKQWLRWGMTGNVAGAILFAVVAFEVAIRGEDPSPAMIFIALTLSFGGVAFTTVGRVLALPR